MGLSLPRNAMIVVWGAKGQGKGRGLVISLRVPSVVFVKRPNTGNGDGDAEGMMKFGLEANLVAKGRCKQNI